MIYLESYKFFHNNPIKKLLNSINDFFAWNKEHKEKGFILAKRVFHFLDEFKFEYRVSTEIIPFMNRINKLISDFEIEKSYKYSDKKYEIAEEIKELHQLVTKRYNKVFENLVVEYYNKYDSDLMEDVNFSIEWLENSKWYKNYPQNKKILQMLKNRLSTSSIEKEMNFNFNI